MTVTSSEHFKWLPGMKCIWPNGNEYIVGQVNGDGCGYPSNGWGDEYPNRTVGKPDLGDPGTQGHIIFGILEPLGITVSTLWIPGRGEGTFFVHISGDGPMGHLSAASDSRPYGSRADAIQAVFAALDSEAK